MVAMFLLFGFTHYDVLLMVIHTEPSDVGFDVDSLTATNSSDQVTTGTLERKSQ